MSKVSKPAGMAEYSLFSGLVPQPIEPNASIGADGHRSRMRQRLLKAGPEALADHEMLEMILFIALPRRDTKPLARELLVRFRSLGGVLGAPPDELRETEGIGEAGAAAVKLVQAAALRMMRQELSTQPILSTWDKLTDYLTASMEHERTEHFRILFLDGKNKLIADEVHHRRRDGQLNVKTNLDVHGLSGARSIWIPLLNPVSPTLSPWPITAVSISA